MQFGIIGLVVLLLIGGGVYFMQDGGSMDKAGMEQKVMIEKEVMEKDAMTKVEMTKGEEGVMEKDAVMEKDTMQKDGVMMKDESSMKKDGEMMVHGGTYEAYSAEKIAWAQNGKVVLFFRASWCPTCRAVDGDIKKNIMAIPKDVTILDVNYDTEIALKQKYGVTYQHTFVQVDASGNQITKWSASPTLAALLTEVQ